MVIQRKNYLDKLIAGQGTELYKAISTQETAGSTQESTQETNRSTQEISPL